MSEGLSERDFDRVSRLIGKAVGIRLGPDKRVTVEGRLRRRVRALGMPDIGAYCRWLFDGDGLTRELPNLVDVITTNKTDFFRERDHFDLLARRLVPELLARRRGVHPVLKLWSAACSTGAELYSAAFVLGDLMERGGRFEFEMLGSDISAEVLETARLGVYPAEFAAPVPAELRRFLMAGRSARMAGQVRVAADIRRRCRFERVNLMDPRYPVPHDLDVVFLRNVLIYFDRRDQEAVIRRCLARLRPGGFLLLSHTETVLNGVPATPVAPSVFQKEPQP
jgi:chemotaxis protein methyltransferase CheR